MVESFRFLGMPTSGVYITCDVHVAMKMDPNAKNTVRDFHNYSVIEIIEIIMSVPR